MASRIDFVDQINVDHQTDWRIKVRIIRLWEVPGYVNPIEINKVEMVVMDERVFC